MEFKMPNVFVLVALGCAGLGLIFQIVGVATAGWVTGHGVGIGLWETCGSSDCINLDKYFGGFMPDYYNAVRAFGILGLMGLAGCVVVGCLICFMDQPLLPLVAAVLGFISGVCILVEFAVYAGKSDLSSGQLNFSYGYSFALTIVAWLLAIGAGVCFVVAKQRA